MTARFPRRRRRVKKKKAGRRFRRDGESPIITRRPMPSRGNPKHEARYDEIPTRDEGGDARTSGSERRFFARVRRYNTFHHLRARGAASHRRLSGRSPGSLALLELDGVHGDVAPDQHDGGARGAEYRGAALGLRGRGRGGKVAGEFSGVARCQKPARVGRADFGSGLAFGWRSAEVGGSGGTHRADVVHLLGVDVRLRRGRKRGWERSATDARRETRGTLAKYRQPTEGQSRGRDPVRRGHAPARRRPRAWGRRC